MKAKKMLSKVLVITLIFIMATVPTVTAIECCPRATWVKEARDYRDNYFKCIFNVPGWFTPEQIQSYYHLLEETADDEQAAGDGEVNVTDIRNLIIGFLITNMGMTPGQAAGNLTLWETACDWPPSPPIGTYLEVSEKDYCFFTEDNITCTNFNVSVNVQDVTDMKDCAIKLGYNSSLINAVRVYPTAITKDATEWLPVDALGNFHFDAHPTINNTRGYVWVDAWGFTPFTGSGTVFKIEFHIKKAPPYGMVTEPENKCLCCILDLFDTEVLDSLADPIYHAALDGHYCYTRPQNLTGRAEKEWIDQFVQCGEITSGYCNRTRNGVKEEHPGVDIGKKDAAGRWTGCWDVTAGIVGHVEKVYKCDKHYTYQKCRESDWLKNFNTVVIKESATGNFYLYAHLRQIFVNECDNVTATTVIGKMGGYGAHCANTFGPHLHLEIRKDKDGDGMWGKKEEENAVSGSKNCSVQPPHGVNNNTITEVEGKKEGLMYSYTITNDVTSTLNVTYFRLSYNWNEPYEVVNAPSGWNYSLWTEAPSWIEWWTTDAAYAVHPGDTLTGFAYNSTGPTYYVEFYTAPDDAGHGGGLGPDEVRVLGVSQPPVGGIWVPVDKFGLLAPYIALASTILVATVATAIYVKRVKRVKRRKKKQ